MSFPERDDDGDTLIMKICKMIPEPIDSEALVFRGPADDTKRQLRVCGAGGNQGAGRVLARHQRRQCAWQCQQHVGSVQSREPWDCSAVVPAAEVPGEP